MKLKINPNRSAAENVVDLIDFSDRRSELLLNANNYTFRASKSNRYSRHNTKMNITLRPGAKYKGPLTVYYTRVDISRSPAVVDMWKVQDLPFYERLGHLFGKFVDECGYVRSDLAYLPNFQGTQMTIYAKPDALLYVGSFTVDIVLGEPSGDVPLKEVVTLTTLNGFHLPV